MTTDVLQRLIACEANRYYAEAVRQLAWDAAREIEHLRMRLEVSETLRARRVSTSGFIKTVETENAQ